MNHSYPCFWSLLDNDNFNFVYASRAVPDDIQSIFKRRSLLDLIHPDEADLAQQDLKRFVAAKSSNGSVTRCRLRNFVGYKPPPDVSPSMSNSDWLIVDVIVYAATNQLLLAFFHVDPGSLAGRHTNSCGERFFDGPHDTDYIRTLLNKQRSSAYPSNNQRFLHIFDSRTKTAVLSWPERYHHENNLTDFIDSRAGTASCFNSSRHSSRDVSPAGTLAVADHIIIPYGCITFVMTTIPPPQSSVPVVTTTVAAQANSARIIVKHQQGLTPSIFNDNHDNNSHLQYNDDSISRLPSLHDLPHLAEESIFGSSRETHLVPNTASSNNNKNISNIRPLGDTKGNFLPSLSSSSTSSPTTTKRYNPYNDTFDSIALPPMETPVKPFIPYARRNASTTNSPTVTSATATSDSNTSFPPTNSNSSATHLYHQPLPLLSAPKHYQRHSPPPSSTSSLTTTAAHAYVRKRRHSSSARVYHHHHHLRGNSNSNSTSIIQNHCESCGTDSSPEWRKGPSGHKTLCNACGLRWKRSLTRKEKLVQQQQQQQHNHSQSTYNNLNNTTSVSIGTTNALPITTAMGPSSNNTRYSAPSSPLSSCSSSSSSSSSASSSPTSLVGPMTPHYISSTSTSTSCRKSFYDHSPQQQQYQQPQHYDPVFRY